MRWVGSIAQHVLDLFIDDSRLALGTLVWLTLNGLLAARIGLTPAWRGPVLFAGFAFILAWACLRTALRRSR